jgi:hypothetical protein
MEQAPDEVGAAAVFMVGPPEGFKPEALQGRVRCSAILDLPGEEEAGRRALAPMLQLGHVGGFITALPYADFQCMLDDRRDGNYRSAEYLGGLPDAAVGAFCASAEGMIVPSGTQHPLFLQGGAIARGPSEYPIP